MASRTHTAVSATVRFPTSPRVTPGARILMMRAIMTFVCPASRVRCQMGSYSARHAARCMTWSIERPASQDLAQMALKFSATSATQTCKFGTDTTRATMTATMTSVRAAIRADGSISIPTVRMKLHDKYIKHTICVLGVLGFWGRF